VSTAANRIWSRQGFTPALADCDASPLGDSGIDFEWHPSVTEAKCSRSDVALSNGQSWSGGEAWTFKGRIGPAEGPETVG
jgi:hypothetical protein